MRFAKILFAFIKINFMKTLFSLEREFYIKIRRYKKNFIRNAFLYKIYFKSVLFYNT